MIIKTYQKYILKSYFSCLGTVLLVFICLVFVLNIFEEISFLKDKNNSFYFAILLTSLNVPYLIYEISPFIFLIASQYFFINLYESEEIDSMNKFGLNNFKIMSIISICSFVLGILVITLFYNLSAELKYFYYDLKNKLSEENKYLAAVTANGLWLKDQNNETINFINAEKLRDNYLEKISITVFTKDFDLVKNIESKKADITNFKWTMEDVLVYEDNSPKKNYEKLDFETSFDKEKLYSLFSNLYSVSIWNLFNFSKDNNLINFSSKQIIFHLNKLYSYPFYVTLMALISSVVMLNLNRKRNRIFFITVGVLISVSIYFIRYIFDIVGETKDLSPFVSIWLPILFLTIITSFGLVRINEK
tara:strand:- start:1003 stop:2085 length:1083 start_codon:yes stop_codon:yes gene_type:complete